VTASAVRVLQITDTHLLGDPGARLKGLLPEQTLRAVLARARHAHAAPDLVLATGDLADAGEPQAYARIAAHLGALGAPVAWVPGNHDDRETMARELGGRGLAGTGDPDAVATLALGPWRVALIDSTIPGEQGGAVSAAALAGLDRALGGAPSAWWLVALHHPLLPSGTPRMDAMALANPHALLEVVDRHAAVRALLWGHFHHAAEHERNRALLACTPSTCHQLRLGGAEPEIDDAAPGYRWLELDADGGVRTGVERVPVTAPPAAP